MADNRLAQLPQALLPWYEKNRRDLPWRQDREPYHVWLSEIMLQQTRVEAVKGYYTRFLEALPTIEALAKAPQEQLYKLWEGLGYYSRVRNLTGPSRHRPLYRRSNLLHRLQSAHPSGGRQCAAGDLPAGK